MAKVRVKKTGFKNYFRKIVRIESVRNDDGDYLFKRSLVSPYKREISLSAPGKYEFKVLCESPIRFRFEHPILQLVVEDGSDYVIDFDARKKVFKPYAIEIAPGASLEK